LIVESNNVASVFASVFASGMVFWSLLREHETILKLHKSRGIPWEWWDSEYFENQDNFLAELGYLLAFSHQDSGSLLGIAFGVIHSSPNQ
jgi:hypothetical protein